MKVGDYIRTQNRIFKITKLNDEYIGIGDTKFKLHYGKMTKDYYFLLDTYDDYETQTIYKSSPNIIDLIEVGDYVNGSYIYSVVEENKNTGQPRVLFTEEDGVLGAGDIKSIVTKEQFESMEYKVGK